jgi:hypothetical protein
MWRRRMPRSTEEIINESLAKEKKSQESQLKLWKERPRLAHEEIPTKVFQILQKEHKIRKRR